MAIPIIDPFGAMQQGMKMREAREQYESKNKLNDLYKNTDWSNPQAIERAIPQAIAAGGPEAASSFVTLLGHMDDTQRRRAESHRKDVGRVFLQIANAPEERRAALWQQGQGLYPQEFDQPYSPEALRAMQSELQDFDDAFKSYTQGPEAPKRFTREEGGMTITEQWNPATQKMEIISRAPRWQPQQPGADAGAWEVVDMPGVGKVQRNKRTGQVQSLPGAGGTSPGDVIGPILQAVAEGKELTPAQQRAYEMYTRMSPLDRMMNQALGGQVPGGSPQPTTDKPTFETMPSVGTDGAGPPMSGRGAGTASPSTTGTSTSQGTGQNLYAPSSVKDNPLGPTSPEDAAKLPAGTWFTTLDGRVLQRK